MPISIKEVYESDDSNYLALVSAVIDRVIAQREQIANEMKRKSRSG